MSYTVDKFKAISPSYKQIVDDGPAGFEAFTGLQPWYFLSDKEIFDVAEQWPSSKEERLLVAFAVRQDCDDIACFEIQGQELIRVVVIEGWVANSYIIVAEYGSFEEWLKSISDDIAEWKSSPEA